MARNLVDTAFAALAGIWAFNITIGSVAFTVAMVGETAALYMKHFGTPKEPKDPNGPPRDPPQDDSAVTVLRREIDDLRNELHAVRDEGIRAQGVLRDTLHDIQEQLCM
jgi:hypothetical protein